MKQDWAGLTDRQLADHARRGDQLAYREFMRRYKPPIYRMIMHQIGDEAEALDLTQEAFISAFSSMNSYDGARSFRAWIGRIAINKCRDWARRRKVRALFTAALPLEKAVEAASLEPLADEILADQQEIIRVQAAVAALPAKLREILLLRTIEELTQAETATVLNISQKAVETRLYRARLRLKDLLARTE